ncbi:hypothetical protein [Phytohabitans rumicis]|uniref:Uncharacterized protein n=1 Tax=Phytohabitans rumicis TaxID=1076125 RepID=A0A6V8LI58_9ACTN|nr:hypothetical protein [Phytohabitans rumicis]GFJ93826.1 hypothetical protein Prum_074680 [Phytohabitans rumicis]
MTDSLLRFADRMLERLVPKATAKADSTYWVTCYCSGGTKWIKRCHNINGTTSCEPCILGGGC